MRNKQLLLLTLLVSFFITFNQCTNDDVEPITMDVIEVDKADLTEAIALPTNEASGMAKISRANGDRIITFHAKKYADGIVKGSGNLLWPSLGKVHFDIQCLTVEGNTATIGGKITSWTDHPEYTGRVFVFIVEDNGNDGSMDRLSWFYWDRDGKYPPVECTPDYEEPLFNLHSGNILVK